MRPFGEVSTNFYREHILLLSLKINVKKHKNEVSPAGKGLTSWLSFVVSNCEFVTFPLVSWVGRGT